MKLVTQVNQTYDYSIFKTLDGNRRVNKLHVKRLEESFHKHYLLCPIIVNDKYQIIDGQHRFEAAKKNGLPINFFIAPNYGLNEVQTLNQNMKNWKKEDYLSAYCDLGYPQYLKFKEFMNLYPDFGIAACETILTNKSQNNFKKYSKELMSESNNTGCYMLKYFQEGELYIPNYDLSLEIAEKIMMVKPYYDGYNRNTFVKAMIAIFKVEYYNHAKFLNRLKSNPSSMEHCSNVTQYKLLIEDIYNFRSREKVSLRY